MSLIVKIILWIVSIIFLIFALGMIDGASIWAFIFMILATALTFALISFVLALPEVEDGVKTTSQPIVDKVAKKVNVIIKNPYIFSKKERLEIGNSECSVGFFKWLSNFENVKLKRFGADKFTQNEKINENYIIYRGSNVINVVTNADVNYLCRYRKINQKWSVGYEEDFDGY
jgi:hypothetical protein